MFNEQVQLCSAVLLTNIYFHILQKVFMYFLCLAMLLALAHQCIAQEETSTSQTPYETPSFTSSQENLPSKEQLCRDFFNEINNKCRMLDETPKSADAAEREAIKQNLIEIVFNINPGLSMFLERNKLATEKNRPHLKQRALLFTGQQGLGKTLAAQALAKKLNAQFTKIDASSLGTEYQNSASANLKRRLEQVKEPRVPHVVLIDEIHKLADQKKQEHCSDMDPATTLWQFMDDPAHAHIILVATANDITNLPAPLKERLERGLIVFSPLSLEARQKILEAYIGKQTMPDVVKHSAKNTSGMSIRQLHTIAETAEFYACTRNAETISKDDLDKAKQDLQAAINAGNTPFLSKKNFKENGWAYANLLLDTARVVIGSVQLIKDARTNFTKDNTASTINSSSETDKISTSNQTQTSQTSTAA